MKQHEFEHQLRSRLLFLTQRVVKFRQDCNHAAMAIERYLGPECNKLQEATLRLELSNQLMADCLRRHGI